MFPRALNRFPGLSIDASLLVGRVATSCESITCPQANRSDDKDALANDLLQSSIRALATAKTPIGSTTSRPEVRTTVADLSTTGPCLRTCSIWGSGRPKIRRRRQHHGPKLAHLRNG